MIIDISPPLSDQLKVWPGDTPMTREISLDMTNGDAFTLSAIRATVHLGAHVDAPSHYGASAPGVDAIDLERFVGRCQVVSVDVPAGSRIATADVKANITTERVLFKTGGIDATGHWDNAFATVSPELVDAMHARGVRLIGIDAPSMDTFDAKVLVAHQRFLACGIVALEGLVLSHVPDGVYELIAMPLRLVDFDASPVRAVLRPIKPKPAQ